MTFPVCGYNIYLIDHVYISFAFDFGMCLLAYSISHLVYGICVLAYSVKHFVSISSVTFWHLYSTRAFKLL